MKIEKAKRTLMHIEIPRDELALRIAQPCLGLWLAGLPRSGGQAMRPRWQSALIVFTTPIWLLPALFYIGWCEAGRDYFKEIPTALRWIFKGIRP